MLAASTRRETGMQLLTRWGIAAVVLVWVRVQGQEEWVQTVEGAVVVLVLRLHLPLTYLQSWA